MKKYGRNLKRYFTDIAVTLTNNFNRHNQKLLKRIMRGMKSLWMKIVPKVNKNVTAIRN